MREQRRRDEAPIYLNRREIRIILLALELLLNQIDEVSKRLDVKDMGLSAKEVAELMDKIFQDLDKMHITL